MFLKRQSKTGTARESDRRNVRRRGGFSVSGEKGKDVVDDGGVAVGQCHLVDDSKSLGGLGVVW